MGLKQVVTRFATLVLSCLMVLSVPLTALADGDVNQNANSGGAIPSGEDAAYAHKFYAYPCNQGWRFTIVDNKGNPVSNSVDAVVYFPTHIENIALANKTPTVSGATGSTSELLAGYQRYKHWIGWTDNSKGGLNQTKDKSLMMSNGIKTREFTDISWNHFGVPNTVVNGRSIGNKVYPITMLNDYLRDAVKYLIEKEGGTVDANKLAELSIPVPSILNGNQFSAGGTLLKEMANKAVNEFNTDSNKELESNVIKAVLNAKAPVFNNKCEYAGNEDFLFRYINPEDNSKLGDKMPAEIFTEKQYKLAVEPIYFGIPELVAYDTGVIQKFGGFHVAWASGVWYGTVSYINKQFYDLIKNNNRLKELGMTDGDLDKCTVFPDWGFGNMGPTTAMLSHNEESMGLYEPSQEGHNLHRLTNGFSLYSMASGDRYRTVGYALHLYTPDMLEQPSGTPTWDSSTYPSDNYNPGPAPDTSDRTKYPKETSYNNNNNKANIVKFYVRKQGDSEVPVSNFTRESTLHTININDEPGYKVVDYFSSGTYKKPESSSTTYESVKSTVPNGSLKGTSSGSVVLTPESNENTLYIKLISNVKVVKVYETGGNVDKVVTDTNPNITNNTLNITTPDNGYEYTENIQSPTDKTPSSWEDVPEGTPGTEVNVPLRDDTTTIYIHYHKDGSSNTGLVLHENELSHQFGLSDVKGTLLDGIRKYSSVSVSGSCPEIWYCSDDDCDGHRCGASYEYQNSDDWTYTIENVPSYNTQFVWKWLQTDQKSYSGNGLSESGGEGHSTPDMKMVLQRSISDKATLYPKLNADESTLKAMGLQGAAYQPVHQRKDGVSDQPSRKSWTETFTTNWTFTAHNTPTAYFETDHGYTETDEHTNTGNESELNSNYSQSGNTLVYGLWGKANTGATAPSTKAEQFQLEGVNEASMKMKSTFEAHNKFMSYYPYYNMRYVDELNGSEKQAYLTSENLSKLSAINRVDVSVSQTQAGIPLDLTSTQWSIHRGAQRLLSNNGIGDKNSLLPSGAIYNLQMKGGASDGLWVKFRTYQTAVDDSDKVKLEATSDMKVLSDAKNKSTTFKDQVKRVLDNYEVVLLGSKGFTDENTIKGEWNQITGSAKKNKPFGAELASDDKYKLEAGNNNGKANASDLDILKEVDIETIWKLTSDADGNVRVYKNNGEVSSINKTQGVNQLIGGNTELSTLDDRTKVITNFINSLDRNLGSDRSGRTWYNEGFESVLVYERDFAFLLGFGNNAPVRSAALNIKLNGQMNSRHEMFTGENLENTARSFQFRTSKKSVLSEASGKPDGWVGDFEGLTVVIPQVDNLLTSKLFYTSNTTVMDLN